MQNLRTPVPIVDDRPHRQRRLPGTAALRLSPESSASADAEALLDSPVFLAVLRRRPDERPSDDREREHADGGNHYLEEGAHDGSLGSAGRQPARPGQRSRMAPEEDGH